MIAADMREYNYRKFGAADAYGQPQLSPVLGTVKMAIYTAAQATQDNIRYKDWKYTGLTHSKVDDTYVIEYEGEMLKVLYTNHTGRYLQVFMGGM